MNEVVRWNWVMIIGLLLIATAGESHPSVPTILCAGALFLGFRVDERFRRH